jgi:MFS transporter, DHA2 family, multidrug resistance protein
MSNSGAAQATAAAFQDGLPVPRRYWSIAAIILALSMSVIDSTIANVALPTIGSDFHASKAASIWVINAYQVAILASLLPLASLGEIVGYRRVSQLGMLVFVVASLGCALAPSLLAMSIARVIQGLGAAGIMSVNTALVRFTYPQHMLGRAIGINAFAVATAAAIGPTVASAILAVGHWRWLFAINIPIGIVAIAIANYALPVTERHSRKLNWVGAALHACTFALLVGGLQALAHDTAATLAIGQIVCAFAIGWALVRHEIRLPSPIVPFDLLRIRLFSLSVLTSLCSFTAQMAALVALPFEIQRLGHSAVETGLFMTPWPVGVGLAAPIAGRLADRYPAGILSALGLLVMAIGMTLLAFFPETGGSGGWIWRMGLCGLGFGFFQSPNNRAMVSTAPRQRSGAAGGLLSTARLLGQTLGAAGVAILFRAYPAGGSNIALCAAAGVAFGAAIVSLLRLKPQASAAASRHA